MFCKKQCIILVDLWQIKSRNTDINTYYKSIYSNIKQLLENNIKNNKLDVYDANSNKCRPRPSFLKMFKTLVVGDYIGDKDQYSKISTQYILDNYDNIYICGLSLDECCMGSPLGYKRLKAKGVIVKDCTIQQDPSSDVRIKFNTSLMIKHHTNLFLNHGSMPGHARGPPENLGEPVIYEKINYIKTWKDICD